MVPFNLIKEDYNLLAPTYDEYFSRFVEPSSKELVKKLDIPNNYVTALDLACGTGTIASELTNYIKSNGKITLVDSSERMLERAKEKIGQGKNVEFLLGDMQKLLDKFPNNNFDYVTCGWTIGYSNPLKTLKKVKNILKSNAKVAIIENRRDTLLPIRKTGLKVARKYAKHIQYLMALPLRLPKDKNHLRKMFIKSNLKPIDIWEGEIKFHFNNGQEVLNWALHTGASAGFDRIMDQSIKDKADEAFIDFIEKDYKNVDGINISHNFVAGIAKKI